MNSKDIYWNIDAERRRRGMTSKEFCTRIGISTKTWKNYESNSRPMPMGVVEDAANLMMIPMQELVRGRRTI